MVVVGFIIVGKLLQFVVVNCVNEFAWMLKRSQLNCRDICGMNVLENVSSLVYMLSC